MARRINILIGTTLAVLLMVAQVVTGSAIFTSPVYGANAKVTGISVDAESVDAAGGEVNLTVQGEGLTADNWGISVEVFFGGTDVSATDRAPKAAKVEVAEQTAEGAVLTVSANGVKNDLDVVVHAGAIGEDGMLEEAEARFKVAGKNYDTADVSPSQAVMTDNTVQVIFEGEVVELADSDNSYKKVSLTTTDGKAYSLTNEDSVSASGDSINIELHDSLYSLLGSNSTSIYVVFGEHAMRLKSLPANTYNQEFKWILTTKPTISKITLDKDVFDHNGGKVVATLGGTNATAINLDSIQAELLVAGSNKSAGIKLTKGRDTAGNPTITYTVPANTGDQTQSYYLNVKVDGSPVYQATTENKANLAIVSVVPEGADTSAATLSAVNITANGGGTPIEGGVEATVSKSIGSLKTEIRLFGTGLNDTKTKLRITDENGIEWPVYDIGECDGSWRFIAIAGIRKNGLFGNGNTQLIELLPARYAGTNKTFTIEVAPDGENFDEKTAVKLKINNEGIKDEIEFRDCTSNNFKYIDVKYVDEQGKEISEADRYQCYEISMPVQFVKAKEIDGYEVVTEPELDEWVNKGRSYKYVYKKIEETADPVYNQVPGYQKKNVFETETNTIRGLKVTGNFPADLEFKIFNTTTQEEEARVKAANGVLPNLKLKKNHNYIISASKRKDDATYYTSKTYIWNNNGVLKDIKSNYSSKVADKDWKYNSVTSIAVTEVAASKFNDDDRYAARLKFYIGESDIAAYKTINFISALDTVTVETKSNGMVTANLLEDVAYTVTVDDPKYDIQSFPLVVKDKSEYGNPRYTYDHTTCHYVGIHPGTNVMDAPIHLVEKDKAHDEDTTITSGTGKTTISGFKFNDLIAKESKLDTNVEALEDNTYDVISVKVINPHRWEVSKICAGEFTISEKYDKSRKVKNVYLLKEGELEAVNYELKNGSVEFNTTSLSLYPVVIEYSDKEEPEEQEISVDRIEGATRYDTALNAANQYMAVTGKKSLDTIIVTYGENFPDALAGGYLAKVKDAPIVIVNGKNEKKIEDYIYDKVDVGGTVYILGSDKAVSNKFENALKSDFSVKRLGGATRYDTNIEILKEAGVQSEDLLVCTGGNFADSLSASAAGRPIFIVGNELTASQKEYLRGLTPEKVYAIGSSSVVSDRILEDVKAATKVETIERIAGKTRYETSIEVAKKLVSSNPSKVFVTTGKNFPDGLAGGPLAYKLGAPLILVNTANDNKAAVEYCKNANVAKSIAMGSTVVVSEAVRKGMLTK